MRPSVQRERGGVQLHGRRERTAEAAVAAAAEEKKDASRGHGGGRRGRSGEHGRDRRRRAAVGQQRLVAVAVGGRLRRRRDRRSAVRQPRAVRGARRPAEPVVHGAARSQLTDDGHGDGEVVVDQRRRDPRDGGRSRGGVHRCRVVDRHGGGGIDRRPVEAGRRG